MGDSQPMCAAHEKTNLPNILQAKNRQLKESEACLSKKFAEGFENVKLLEKKVRSELQSHGLQIVLCLLGVLENDPADSDFFGGHHVFRRVVKEIKVHFRHAQFRKGRAEYFFIRFFGPDLSGNDDLVKQAGQ